jgi:hypothetical protein
MHVSSVCQLRRALGLGQPETPIKVTEPYQMLGEIAPDLADALGVDVVGLAGTRTMFGFENADWKPWTLSDGTAVLVPGAFNTKPEPNGDILMYPEGDHSAPPSGRMPKGGYYFDTIVRQEPIDDEHLDVEDNLEEFGPISDAALQHFASEAERLWRDTDRAILANFGGTAFGDIALVPAPWLKHPKGIRDVAEWYMSTRSRQAYIHAVFGRQCEIGLKNLEKIRAAAGDLIDVVFLCGTDFGTQTSAFCSVATFRELWLPYYREICGWMHRKTQWKCFKHSCGSVERFIESMIEAGFDILNPVQCSAAGMEAEGLKAKYGDRITFWGGGVDTQKTLPFGTPGEVREQVLRRCEVFAKNGGFVFNSIHNIQAGTPVGNIVAMLDAVKEFNGR